MGVGGAHVVSVISLGGADDAVALVTSRDVSTGYRALRQTVASLAEQLAKAGASPGHVVAVARSSPEQQLVHCLAGWSTGAIVWPVDLRGSKESIAALMAQVHPACVAREEGIEARSSPRSHDERAGLLLFTSGSTAAPKGVLLPAAGLAANVEAILGYLPIREHPVTALVLPLVYSYALVGQALTTLRAGGRLLLLNDLPYAAAQLDAMAKQAMPMGLSSVPTSLRLLARACLERPAAQRPQLAYVASDGGALDADTVELVRSAFPGARVFNQYGLTEASPRVTAISDDSPLFALGSIGRPISGVQVFAVNLKGERLPTDASGELAVRSPSVMLGYLDDPEGTAHALAADGTLRTGDVGHVDADGYVFFEDRHDGVVKVAGERVSLQAVAEALRVACPTLDVQVVALADEVLGSRLVAVVEGGDAQVPEVRRAARDHLPAHQRPARIIAMEHLPRTLNGKIDLFALRALAEHP